MKNLNVKEHPILFSGPMVKAILEGKKIQTRRTKKLEKINKNPDDWFTNKEHLFFGKDQDACYWKNLKTEDSFLVKCPYGKIGERLWVRETFAVQHEFDPYKPSEIPKEKARLHFEATEDLGGLIKRPSLFMPRSASRITLEITNIRVEQLQEISEEDSKLEGAIKQDLITRGEMLEEAIICMVNKIEVKDDHYDKFIEKRDRLNGTFKKGFSILWEQINGKGSWKLNPWVWVLEFKKI
jgi:hypothetical protein